jgi:hypothetical protein
MNLLNDLKSVDPKRPGGWPMPVKLVTFGAIFLLAVVLVI